MSVLSPDIPHELLGASNKPIRWDEAMRLMRLGPQFPNHSGHVKRRLKALDAQPHPSGTRYSSCALARAHVAGPPPSFAITARGSGLGFACSGFEHLTKMALGEPGLRLDHINRSDRASG